MAAMGLLQQVHFPAHLALRKSKHQLSIQAPMESTDVDIHGYHFYRTATSPFFIPPSGSPQPWELHDVDFLLPGPMSGRPDFQDSTRRRCSSLHELEITSSLELEDTTKSLTFRPGVNWQDMALVESTKNEFSGYFNDDVFSDTVHVVSTKPDSAAFRTTLVPPANLRVNAHSPMFKHETSAVSPSMIDRKILVTNNDLRLFSVGSSSVSNMRTLCGRKVAVKKSPREDHPGNVINSTAVPQQNIKRQFSIGNIINCTPSRPLKRTKSADQFVWSASSMNSRWYCVRTEGFHGIQPRLLTSMSLPSHPGPSFYQLGAQLQKQHSRKMLSPQYAPPKRKIGIYPPAERRERLKRFHEKRKLRVYHKRIKYDCRKRLANSCPRVKGRFVRKSKSNDFTSESASRTVN